MASISDRVEKAYEDIKSMKVRGALNIALYAAEILLNVVKSADGSTDELISTLTESGNRLKEARPSAVSLPNTIDYLVYLANKNKDKEISDFKKIMSGKIQGFIDEQKNALDKIAEIGSGLIEDGDDILTHCNSDTAIAILKRAWDKGKKIKVVFVAKS